MHNKCLIITTTLTLWLIYTDVTQCNDDSCWNNENDCNIKMELFKSSQFSDGISMQIDCLSNFEVNSQDRFESYKNPFQITENKMLLPHLMGVKSLMLDGCQTPLNVYTFGLELLPVCANITKASIRHFNVDTLKPLYCNESPQQLQLEYLSMQNNEIAMIDEDSFPQSYYHLREVIIEKNLLKVIHKDAFKSIRSLENLYIINEPSLVLKFPELFEYSSAISIHLETLKQMTSDIFNHLPETLQNFFVANTHILVENDAVFVNNSLILKSVTIRNCAVEQFVLRDVHSTVKSIDLSGNVMKLFTAYENNLKELNLSGNQLECLPLQWIENLTNLESLILRGNKIQMLSLDNLLQAVPNGQVFDLSQNRLRYLQGYEADIPDAQIYQVHLKCDENPWDCLWLHDFAHNHPEKFRILQYKKFISKINVNGLECVPADKPSVPDKPQKVDLSANMDRIVNVSAYTLMYGNPWEFKRNQRAEALIIVFMLPLGIALLFVLLYMWIYCQNIFHLSYYQSFPCIRRTAKPSAQRFDIVRQLPPRTNQVEPRTPLTRIIDENDEGYEIPISGIISECNCMVQQNTEIAPCQKATHITYEQLPASAAPHQIYEEIIQVDDYESRTHS